MSKIICTLNNKKLVGKCSILLKELIKTGGRSWTLPIPANPNKNIDLLLSELSELIKRFKEGRFIP